MSKQDRQGARTPADLERKYNFGQSFAEAMGIATDAKEKANNASATAAEALSAATSLDKSLTQDEIFNRLTNGGKEQGFYLQDGKVFVNATYIKSGTLSGDRIDGSTLNITSGATIAGWGIDNNSIFKNAEGGSWGTGTFMCTGSNSKFDIGGSGVINGWVFGAGGKFGVTSSGDLYCSALHANDGCRLGEWYINGGYISNAPPGAMGLTNIVHLGADAVYYTHDQALLDTISATWKRIVDVCRDQGVLDELILNVAELEERISALEQ